VLADLAGASRAAQMALNRSRDFAGGKAFFSSPGLISSANQI
jgi:hypothetical protein